MIVTTNKEVIDTPGQAIVYDPIEGETCPKCGKVENIYGNLKEDKLELYCESCGSEWDVPLAPAKGATMAKNIEAAKTSTEPCGIKSFPGYPCDLPKGHSGDHHDELGSFPADEAEEAEVLSNINKPKSEPEKKPGDGKCGAYSISNTKCVLPMGHQGDHQDTKGHKITQSSDGKVWDEITKKFVFPDQLAKINPDWCGVISIDDLPCTLAKGHKGNHKDAKGSFSDSQIKGADNNYGGKWSGGTGYVHCKHDPFKAIVGKDDKWSVWAGRKFDVEMEAKAGEFDVVLNLANSGSIKSTYQPVKKTKHTIPIPELKKWEKFGMTPQKPVKPFHELEMDWPDMGVVAFPMEFWISLVDYLESHNARLLVFCVGGHGRTGTALAAMLMAALGWKSKQATDWVRKNYCSKAIESKTQEDYLKSLDKDVPVKK